MPIQPPKIDQRDRSGLLRDLEALMPFYTAQWRVHESGPGRALVEAFLLFQRQVLRRLNRVPDKLFLTFLDQLGLSLCPALPARVPVRFALAQGTTEEVTIPPRTQVASRDTIFETDTAFVASPSTLQAVLSVVPERDLILDHRENLIASQTAELFTEQVGQGNLQEHSFYLGDLRLFNLRAAGTIALLVSANQPDLLRSNAVRWEWWGRAETSGPAAQWQPFTVAGSGDTVLLSKAAGEIEELDIDGLKHRWIRCRITGPLRPGDSLATLVISAIAVASARADLPPDVAFANDIPLPLPVSNAQPLAPFGARPREGDTFHLAAQDVFSKTGTTVALSAENVTPMPADPPPSAVLSWEYWDGQGWQALPLLPGSTNKDFRRTGPVRVAFVIPPTMSQTRVVGQENYWIRIRIASGDFGQEIFTPGQLPDIANIKPPRFSSLTLAYSVPAQPPATVVTLNNLQYDTLPQTASFAPFVPLDDGHQAVYLGFDRPLINGPFSTLVTLQEQEYAQEGRPRIAWEYLRSEATPAWGSLDLDDGTVGLTRTGLVTFLGPVDAVTRRRFGRSLFWIRVVDVEDRFGSEGGGLGSQIPLPRLTGIYLNSTWVTQAEVIRDERFGSSDGTAAQTFRLGRTPVVSAEIWVDELGFVTDEELVQLTVDFAGVQEQRNSVGNRLALWVRWTPVADLATAGSDERVYGLDPVQGLVQFGDGLHGKIPPVGRQNLKADYRIGGGSAGNVALGAIKSLRTTVAGIDTVGNPLAAAGGADTESISSLIERGPRVLKHRHQAVTAEDYEWLAREASRAIAKVHCLPHFDEQRRRNPGWVTVLIVPHGLEARPFPSPTLREQVKTYLTARAANVVTARNRLVVAGPVYLRVSVTVDLYPASLGVATVVEQTARTRLAAFLHPLTGGLDGRGWEFGHLPCPSDFLALLQGIEGVDHLESLSVRVEEPAGTTGVLTMDGVTSLTPPPYTLVSTGTHQIHLERV